MSCSGGLDDIEDIINKNDLTANYDRNFVSLRRDVLPKARKLSKRGKCMDEKPVADSLIPGTQKIYIKTWGCSHNNSDSEYMAGQLASYGYKIIGNILLYNMTHAVGLRGIKIENCYTA